MGLAPDGGLFLPEHFPDISDKLDSFKNLSYADLAAEFMSLFAPEISKQEWHTLTQKAYATFSVDNAVKLHTLKNNMHVLELFYGPTLAFKDFALQLVGALYERESISKNKKYTIVGATSGDTGSAAIYGVINNPSVKIFILYPYGKIAKEQELQITTTGSANVFPVSIEGSFDDAQRIVKELFSDAQFSKQIHIAAVNSINIARILAQSIYYLYTYLKLYDTATDKRIRFIVPTGNFGNVLSVWILNKMGISCDFVFATNQNDVLDTLWKTGVYMKKEAQTTHAPLMDIQQASNFERMLYFMYNQNPETVKNILQQFNKGLGVSVNMSLLPKNIQSCSVSDLKIEQAITDCFNTYSYTLDPHTACAYDAMCQVHADANKADDFIDVLLATASPAKFPEIVERCTGNKPTDPSIERLKDKEKKSIKMAADTSIIKDCILKSL